MKGGLADLVPHHFPWPNQVKVRVRKRKKHKRRLAYARSGLMCNFAGSKESEYWSFPLPPISPCVASLTSLVSSADVQDLKSKVGYRDFFANQISSLHATLACVCTKWLDSLDCSGTSDFCCGGQDSEKWAVAFKQKGNIKARF